MLIEFSVENFRSIKDEVRFSMVASSGKELRDTNVMSMNNGVQNRRDFALLKSAAVYGPNAGGKTTLVKALATMREIVLDSTRSIGDFSVTPFKFSPDTVDAPTSFEVVFIYKDVRYQYGFSVTKTMVHYEWLYAFPNNRAQTWFERELVSEDADPLEYEYTFGNKLLGKKNVWESSTRPNALFLSVAVQLNSDQLSQVFNWFQNDLIVVDSDQIAPPHTIEWVKKNSKTSILKFLERADFAISNFDVDEEEISSDTISSAPKSVIPLLRYLLEEKEGKLTRVRLTTTHRTDNETEVELDLSDESSGTQKMFSYAGYFLDALENGRVLVIDELNTSLHPLLVKYLVDLVHREETNIGNGQLIFTTHQTSILNQQTFRRDQIWFCDRKRNQSTNVYPLTYFSPRKGVDNLENSYLAGRYGALPFIEKQIPVQTYEKNKKES